MKEKILAKFSAEQQHQTDLRQILEIMLSLERKKPVHIDTSEEISGVDILVGVENMKAKIEALEAEIGRLKRGDSGGGGCDSGETRIEEVD